MSQMEGLEVDFKRIPKAVESEDLVAFANSSLGGAILAGVEEYADPTGLQRGRVVGCDVGDRPRCLILSRAGSCTPPVDVEIVTENTGARAFLRVEIPSGAKKPYSTSGGTYKIRGDGVTRPLRPSELLVLFLEAEEASFIGRFRKATGALQTDLATLRESTAEETQRLVSSIHRFANETLEHLGQVAASADEAHCFSEEAQYAAITAVEELERLSLDLASHHREFMKADDGLTLIGKALGVDLDVIRLKAEVQFVAGFAACPTFDTIYRRLKSKPGPVQDGRVRRKDIKLWCEEAQERRIARRAAAG